MPLIEKPKDGEFPPYANMYIKLLPDDGLLLKHLHDNFNITKELIFFFAEEKLNYRYAANKWTIKEYWCILSMTKEFILTGHCVLQE
jgi:hypothetical protein